MNLIAPIYTGFETTVYSVQQSICEANHSTIEKMKDLFWDAVDFTPDVWNFLQNTVSLIQDHFKIIPTALKTVVKGLAAMNILLFPGPIAELFKVLFKYIPRASTHGGATEGFLNMAYLSGLVACSAGIIVSGYEELIEKASIPLEYIHEWMDIALPWAVALLRLSFFIQLMEISELMDLKSDINEELRDRGSTQVNSGVHLLNLLSLGTNNQEKRTKMLGALDKIKEHAWVVKKASGGTKGTNKAFMKVKADLERNSRNSIANAEQMLKFLDERAVIHVNVQLLGVAANVFAAVSMAIVAHSIALPICGMISAFFYILQAIQSKHGRSHAKYQFAPCVNRILGRETVQAAPSA